jgi:hypothetical protein
MTVIFFKLTFCYFYCSAGQVGRQPIVAMLVPQEISGYFLLSIYVCNDINVTRNFLENKYSVCLSVCLFVDYSVKNQSLPFT